MKKVCFNMEKAYWWQMLQCLKMYFIVCFGFGAKRGLLKVPQLIQVKIVKHYNLYDIILCMKFNTYLMQWDLNYMKSRTI